MPNFHRDKLAASKWARDVLEDGTAVILDTESTGLDENARVCQLAIINLQSDILLDTYVNPQIPIPEEAVAIHGITDGLVADYVGLDILFPQFVEPLLDKMFIIYNADYDTRVIRQHLKAVKPDYEYSILHACAMKEYARFYGDWNPRYSSYKWQRLPPIDKTQAHNALQDCKATLALLHLMANYKEEELPF